MLLHRLTRAACHVAPLLASFPLGAQVVGGVTPFVAYYRPFGHFAPASVYSTSLPTQPHELSAVAWGATAHVALGRRTGLLAQVTATESRVPQAFTPEGPSGPTDARVILATLQGRFDVSPSPRAYHLWLNAGPGVVRHGGRAYARYESTTSVAGTLGATVAVPVFAHLQFTASTALFVYRMDIPMPPELRLNPGSLERGTQFDALFHVGLTLGSF